VGFALLSACAELAVDVPKPPAALAPADNPTTPAKVALGRHLFYDVRLSRNENISCASCHEQARAFSDGRVRSLGTTGDPTTRHAMPLVNVGYAATLTWANDILTTLERQAQVPLFGDDPLELGMASRDGLMLSRLAAEPRYPQLFAAAFPEDPEVSLGNVLKALAAFQRALVAMDAPYDRYLAGDQDALDASAARGLALFESPALGCPRCHGGPLLSGAMALPDATAPEARFENNGLYAAYLADNRGLYDLSGRPEDEGRFKPPSLRNIEVTAPYMHDGSLPTLEAVLAHYERGGAGHPGQSPHVAGFALSEGARHDLLAFLRSLTDRSVLHDPRWSDPWR
jgi:cytochrome c peroxidase